MKNIIILFCFFFAFIFVFSCKSKNSQNKETNKTEIKSDSSKSINKFHLEGNGGWDYLTVDESLNRLFVSHSTVVQVVDLKDGKLIATIQETKGVHGIALAPDLNKGFISCGRDSSIVVFNYKTLEVTDRVKLNAKNPDAILYDPYSKKVFVYNGGSSNATVLDAKTNEIVKTIPLSGKPEFSVTDGKGKIYVNIEDKSELTVINADKLTVEKTWSLSPGEEPSGLAFDNENHRLFSVCGNKLMVVSDADAGKVITTLPIGTRVDGAAFDPVLKFAYSSNGDGTLTIIKEENKDKFTVVQNLPTQVGARTIALDEKTHHLYLPTAEFGLTPEPTNENPHPRPEIKEGTFVILDIVPTK